MFRFTYFIDYGFACIALSFSLMIRMYGRVIVNPLYSRWIMKLGGVGLSACCGIYAHTVHDVREEYVVQLLLLKDKTRLGSTSRAVSHARHDDNIAQTCRPRISAICRLFDCNLHATLDVRSSPSIVDCYHDLPDSPSSKCKNNFYFKASYSVWLKINLQKWI